MFFRKKKSLLDFGKEYVRREFGEEYVEEFVDMHTKVNSGIPIGGYTETAIFLHLMNEIQKAYDEEHPSLWERFKTWRTLSL